MSPKEQKDTANENQTSHEVNWYPPLCKYDKMCEKSYWVSPFFQRGVFLFLCFRETLKNAIIGQNLI